MATVLLKHNPFWLKAISGAVIAALIITSTVWAEPRGRQGNHDYPSQGKVYRDISPQHQTAKAGKERYYFHKGVYYRHDPKGYRVVRPPRGTTVHRLPSGFETLVVAGITYFLLAGIYYRSAPTGYVVVDAPVTPAPAPTSTVNGDVVAVNAALLNVRSGPGLNHTVVGQVHLGEQLVVEETSANWLYVKLPDGSFGWVMSTYTRTLKAAAQG